MDSTVTKGNWNIAKGKLKQTLARLMRDETSFCDGKADELVGRIQKRAAASRKRFQRNPGFQDQSSFGHR